VVIVAHGLDDRPVTLTLSPPDPAVVRRGWTVATQLHPGSTPLEFTAPNLQYLIDSPLEFGPIAMRQFVVDRHTFRFAAHHTGTDNQLNRFMKNVDRVVRHEGTLY